MFIEGGAIQRDLIKQGEAVFSEGDPGDAAYILESGSVGIFKGGGGDQVELARLSGGELFGEMAIIDGSKRMARAVAIEDSVVIRIPADHLASKLAKVDPFLRALVKILVANLRQVHEAYMRRARSVDDYVNAIEHHAEGFRMFLERDREGAAAAEALTALGRVADEVSRLRALCPDLGDPRGSHLTDTDLARRRAEDGAP